MRLFKIFNIQIKVSCLFFPILVFSMFFNCHEQLLVFIVVILIHELAHCYVSAYYNIGISEIKFFIFGGVAEFQEHIEENSKQEIIIASAGPITNFILVFITFLVIEKFHIEKGYIVQLFLTANMIVGLFNLMPVLPLDGGRIVRGIVGNYLGIKRATYLIVGLGYCICILLFVFGIYVSLAYNIEYIFISFLSVYIFFSNKKEKEKIGLISIKNLVLNKKSLYNEGIMDVKHIIAMEFVDIKNIFDEFTLEQYCIITITDTTGKVIGSLSESEIIDAIIEYDNNITLRELMQVNNL